MYERACGGQGRFLKGHAKGEVSTQFIDYVRGPFLNS